MKPRSARGAGIFCGDKPVPAAGRGTRIRGTVARAGRGTRIRGTVAGGPGYSDPRDRGQGGPRQREACGDAAGVLAKGQAGQHLTEQRPELEGVTRASGTDDDGSL